MASRFALLAVFGFALLTASPAAAQYTWGTSPGSANWNSAGNWTGGLPVSGTNTTLTFGSSSQTTLNNDLGNPFTGFTLNQLSFSAVGPAYTIAGNYLDFRTNGSGVAPASRWRRAATSPSTPP